LLNLCLIMKSQHQAI